MSPSWPERYRFFLGPGRAALARLRRFGGIQEQEQEWTTGAQSGDARWQESLEHFASEAPPSLAGANVDLIVSNDLCEFAFIKRPTAITKHAEILPYVRNRLQSVYGERAKQWSVAVERAGDAWLVCSTPSALVEAVQRVMSQHRAQVRSVRPNFSFLWNALPYRLKRADGWFAALERERLVAALAVEGRWRHIVGRRCGNALDGALDILDRERELLGLINAPAVVRLHAPALVQFPVEHRGYRFIYVHNGEPPGLNRSQEQADALAA